MQMGQLKTLTRALLGDNVNFNALGPQSFGPQTWSDSQYTDAVNFATKMYAKFTNNTYTESVETMYLDEGGNRSVIDNPPRCMGVMRVYCDNIVLRESSMLIESAYDRQWRTRTSTIPSRWIETDGLKIMLVPRVVRQVGDPEPVVVVGCRQQPLELTSDTQDLDSRIGEDHLDHLKYAAAAYLLNMQNDEQSLKLGDSFLTIFQALIKE